MDANKILKMVDTTIIQAFKSGHDVNQIKDSLKTRCVNFKKVLLKDEKINIEAVLSANWDEITSSRERYGSFYIRSCKRRIEDLDWVLRSKMKFYNKTEEQIFNLIKLKDKLSINK